MHRCNVAFDMLQVLRALTEALNAPSTESRPAGLSAWLGRDRCSWHCRPTCCLETHLVPVPAHVLPLSGTPRASPRPVARSSRQERLGLLVCQSAIPDTPVNAAHAWRSFSEPPRTLYDRRRPQRREACKRTPSSEGHQAAAKLCRAGEEHAIAPVLGPTQVQRPLRAHPHLMCMLRLVIPVA